MRQKVRQPYHELLDESSENDARFFKVDPVIVNFAFLKSFYRQKFKKLSRIERKFARESLTEEEFRDAVKQCDEISELIQIIDDQYDKIVPWEKDGRTSVSPEHREYLKHFVYDLSSVAHKIAKDMVKGSMNVYREEKRSGPTAVYTIAAARTVINALDTFAQFTEGEELIEINEKKAGVERYLTLEKNLRYRYMPQLEELDSYMTDDPAINMKFLEGLFNHTIDDVEMFNGVTQMYTSAGIVDEGVLALFDETSIKNEEMLAVIYAIKRESAYAAVSGKERLIFTDKKLITDIIETQCRIAETVRELQ
jgi:hypothetical protein